MSLNKKVRRLKSINNKKTIGKKLIKMIKASSPESKAYRNIELIA